MALIKPNYSFTYLPHQAEGITWMLDRESGDKKCGILADDMGLGKTWQTIGLLLNAPVSKTLIVAPTVLIKQWQEALTSASICSSELVARKWRGSPDSLVYLITYDKVNRNLPLLLSDTWDRIVLDEGHFIRNSKTRRSLSLNKLNASRKWILSGTPVQNGLADFKSLAGWLGFECHGNAMCVGLASDIIKRRQITLLADVMPDPPVHHRVSVEYKKGPEQDLFKALVGRLENAMERSFPSSCILELYLRIQMFISHPQIYIDAMRRKYGAYQRDDWSNDCSKLAAFKGLLSLDNKSPTLVFCNFKMEMDYVSAAAKAEGYTVYFIRGGMSGSARQFGIDNSITLAASKKPVMIICQIVAGNCGLNLQHLTRVIFYTQHWNPSVIDQALTRSYRYGQKSDVSVYHLLLGGDELLNIDRCMLAKHQDKRMAAKSLMPELEFPFHPDFEAAAPADESGFDTQSYGEDEDPIVQC